MNSSRKGHRTGKRKNPSGFCHYNSVKKNMKNYKNIGKLGNMAQSLLLYTKSIRFCRKSASRLFPIILQSKRIRLSWVSAFSVNFCKFTEFLQTFAVKSLISLLARKTAKMRRDRHHPNRRKSIVFAKKPLPDYSVNSADTDRYEKRRIPFLRKFSQLLRKLHICFINAKINNTNQTLRIRNAGLHFSITEPNFFTVYWIKNNKEPFTTQKAQNGNGL